MFPRLQKRLTGPRPHVPALLSPACAYPRFLYKYISLSVTSLMSLQRKVRLSWCGGPWESGQATTRLSLVVWGKESYAVMACTPLTVDGVNMNTCIEFDQALPARRLPGELPLKRD